MHVFRRSLGVTGIEEAERAVFGKKAVYKNSQ